MLDATPAGTAATTSRLEVTGLQKRYGSRQVIKEVHLAVNAGEVVGLLGPNGAGKTTCFNVLTGRYRPDRGQVRFAGQDITGLSPSEVARRGISRSFQIMNLFDDDTAIDNVVIALPAVRARGPVLRTRMFTEPRSRRRPPDRPRRFQHQGPEPRLARVEFLEELPPHPGLPEIVDMRGEHRNPLGMRLRFHEFRDVIRHANDLVSRHGPPPSSNDPYARRPRSGPPSPARPG